MERVLYIISILSCILLGTRCVNAPDFEDEPKIEFLDWTTNTMRQGDLNTDSVFIRLSFEDGDGDLGFPSDDLTRDIFIYDVRTGELQEQLKMPEIPEDGTGNGISGEITLRVYNTCCIFPQGIPPCAAPTQYPLDTIQYDIHIEDRAGNESNVVRTPVMILRCE